jgi:hypothetical protein
MPRTRTKPPKRAQRVDRPSERTREEHLPESDGELVRLYAEGLRNQQVPKLVKRYRQTKRDGDG